MDKFKLETSIQFPFFKITELVSYSEVKKPSGIAYILLVLISESNDRSARLSNVLENFGVPKNLHYLFADELGSIIEQDILEFSIGFFDKYNFDSYEIGQFRFTEKGKKIFKEESLPTGVTKEVKIPVYYDIAKNELLLAIDKDLEPKQLKDCALTPEFYERFKCNRDVENFLNLNKGKGISVKNEEVITKVEVIGEFDKWTAKYDCEMVLDRSSISISFDDPVLQKFAENNYNNDIFTKSISYKSRFKLKPNHYEHISFDDFDYEKICGILIPEELADVFKQNSKLIFTKGNYSGKSGILCIDESAINDFNKFYEFIQVDVHDSIIAYVPATFDFKNETFGIITIPLVLKIKITGDELKKVVANFLLKNPDYSEDNFKQLTSLTNITKDHELAYSLMDGYMGNNYEANLVRLNEMKGTAVKNPTILLKHKELTKANYIPYLNNSNQGNLGTVLKITASISTYLGLRNEDVLQNIFSDPTKFNKAIETYELLVSNGFSKEMVLLFVNPVPDALSGKDAREKSLLDLLNFGECFSGMKAITGINGYKSYTINEEIIDRSAFKNRFNTANSLFKNIQLFRKANENLFIDYDGFMSVFGVINDYFNMEESAAKNPNNIKLDLVEKKITTGDYQFVFVNLAAKLEAILKNVYKLDGTLSEMLSEARRTKAIDREIVGDLHDFRENRNAFIHPEDRTAKFAVDDLRRWAKEIFDLGEEKK